MRSPVTPFVVAAARHCSWLPSCNSNQRATQSLISNYQIIDEKRKTEREKRRERERERERERGGRTGDEPDMSW